MHRMRQTTKCQIFFQHGFIWDQQRIAILDLQPWGTTVQIPAQQRDNPLKGDKGSCEGCHKQ